MRDGSAAIFFHPAERKIDAGGDAGGGVDVPGFDPKRRGFDFDPGITFGELAAEAPVGSSALAVNQSGGSEEEGTHADGTEAAQARCRTAEPAEKRGVARVARPKAANE